DGVDAVAVIGTTSRLPSWSGCSAVRPSPRAGSGAGGGGIVGSANVGAGAGSGAGRGASAERQAARGTASTTVRRMIPPLVRQTSDAEVSFESLREAWDGPARGAAPSRRNAAPRRKKRTRRVTSLLQRTTQRGGLARAHGGRGQRVVLVAPEPAAQ